MAQGVRARRQLLRRCFCRLRRAVQDAAEAARVGARLAQTPRLFRTSRALLAWRAAPRTRRVAAGAIALLFRRSRRRAGCCALAAWRRRAAALAVLRGALPNMGARAGGAGSDHAAGGAAPAVDAATNHRGDHAASPRIRTSRGPPALFAAWRHWVRRHASACAPHAAHAAKAQLAARRFAAVWLRTWSRLALAAARRRRAAHHVAAALRAARTSLALWRWNRRAGTLRMQVRTSDGVSRFCSTRLATLFSWHVPRHPLFLARASPPSFLGTRAPLLPPHPPP